MNSETFTQFLKTPAYLYRISYQELKSLVVQYPYCQNLRYLLLKKSQTDQHVDYERNLQMAATYSIERSFLYEQLSSNENVEINRESNVDMTEDVLDLKDLEVLDLEPQKEVLYADEKIENAVKIASSPTIPSLDLNINETSEGEFSADEISEEPNSAFDELFSEVFEDEVVTEETKGENAGHQVSEITDSEEESVEILPREVTDNLMIIEAAQEEEIEMTQEVSSDDIEDLFSESIDDEVVNAEDVGEAVSEEREVDIEAVSDYSSVGLDIVDEVDIPSEVTSEVVTAENISPVVELSIEREPAHSDAIDLSDLLPLAAVGSTEKIEEEEDEIETETEVISPQSSFSNWLKQFNSPQISVEIEDLDSKEEKKKVNYKYELVNGEWKQIKTKVKKKKKKSKAELIAAESVKLSKDVATETLAQLLEKQKHYSKAIKMYERLSLEIPEKSDYFAERIQTLLLKL